MDKLSGFLERYKKYPILEQLNTVPVPPCDLIGDRTKEDVWTEGVNMGLGMAITIVHEWLEKQEPHRSNDGS